MGDVQKKKKMRFTVLYFYNITGLEDLVLVLELGRERNWPGPWKQAAAKSEEAESLPARVDKYP